MDSGMSSGGFSVAAVSALEFFVVLLHHCLGDR